jgi:hypothetical protein
MDLSEPQFEELLNNGCGIAKPEYETDDGSFKLRYGPVQFGAEQIYHPVVGRGVCRSRKLTTDITLPNANSTYDPDAWKPCRDLAEWLDIGRKLPRKVNLLQKLHIL